MNDGPDRRRQRMNSALTLALPVFTIGSWAMRHAASMTVPAPSSLNACTARRRKVLGWTALLCMAGAVPLTMARPGDQDDRRALAAREGGQILPLETLIAQVQAVIPGRLLEAELDHDDGLPVYELRWQMA